MSRRFKFNTSLPEGTKRYVYNTRKFGTMSNAVDAAVKDGFEREYASDNLVMMQVVRNGRWVNM